MDISRASIAKYSLSISRTVRRRSSRQTMMVGCPSSRSRCIVYLFLAHSLVEYLEFVLLCPVVSMVILLFCNFFHVRYRFDGIFRKVQMKYQPWGFPLSGISLLRLFLTRVFTSLPSLSQCASFLFFFRISFCIACPCFYLHVFFYSKL